MGGCSSNRDLLEIIRDSDLGRLNDTSHLLAHWLTAANFFIDFDCCLGSVFYLDKEGSVICKLLCVLYHLDISRTIVVREQILEERPPLSVPKESFDHSKPLVGNVLASSA